MPLPFDKPRNPAGGYREADELFRNANPNPDRRGCPPREVLGELARHERPIGDPWFDHLGECSECYREFQELRARTVTETYGRRWWIAAAAVALVALCGWLLFRWTRSGEPERQEAGVPEPWETVVATLDLQRSSPLRGEGPPPTGGEVRIPRASSQLRILLPVGAEPGPYLVEIRGSGGTVLGRATGEAAIENFVTTLVAGVDLSQVTAGSYRLAIRHAEESWREYAVRIE